MSHPVLGVDVGGSKALAVVLDGDGSIPLTLHRRPTGRRTSPDQLLELIHEQWEEAARAGHVCAAVGVGFPGLVDHERGLVRSSVMLDGWHEVPLGQLLRRATGVPCVVDNDVNVAALAELEARGGPSLACMLMIAVGTGIGGAVCIDGKLFRGASGVSGEIGNTTIDRSGEMCWCGRRGCLNVLASGTAIKQLELDIGHEAAAVRAAHDLGVGIANAVQLLNPNLVVLGGGLLAIGDQFLAHVRQVVAREAFPEALAVCHIEWARAGYAAAAIGAGLLARATTKGT